MALYWPTLQFYLCMYISFVCWYMAPPGEWYYNTLLCCNYFSLSTVVLSLSALCMYSKFGHMPHSHPLGYLCAKFCFFRGPHCWASLWGKLLTQSVTHPSYLMPLEPKLGLQNYILTFWLQLLLLQLSDFFFSCTYGYWYYSVIVIVIIFQLISVIICFVFQSCKNVEIVECYSCCLVTMDYTPVSYTHLTLPTNREV